MTIQRHLIPAGHGASLRLSRGQHLRLIDPEGEQSGDLFAVSQDGRQRLSNGRTFDFGGTVYLSTGNQLWSDRSEPLLSIVADDVGRHDFLYAPCNDDMYRLQYGLTGHANCYANLTDALRTLEVPPLPLPTAFNFFMNVEIEANGSCVFTRRNHARATRWCCVLSWTWQSRCRPARHRPATLADRRNRWRTRSSETTKSQCARRCRCRFEEAPLRASHPLRSRTEVS